MDHHINPTTSHHMEDYSNPSSWEYHITLRDGLFYTHPLDVGGPFHSLSEAAAAIKCHTTWASAIQLLTNEYYLVLKDGLLHVHPDGVGGPFKWLEDATDAVASHSAWKKRQEEIRIRNKFLDEADPAVYIPRMKATMEMLRIRYSDERPKKPKKRSWMDEVVASLEPKGCDPAILEEAARFERIVAEKELTDNGMKWMENEVLQAFESYKSSSGYQGPKYEFVKLDQQCLINDSSSKSYHHYNFTMKRKSSFYLRKKREKRSWDYQLFFAEVKPTTDGKQFICCPLQRDENGHCSGCQNVGIDLRHPTNDGYEKGQEKSGFPYDSFGGSDD